MPGTITATVTVKRKSAIGPGLLQNVARRMTAVAEQTMTQAKELCPVDTGALRGTGHVTPPVISGTSVRVDMAFGGPAAPYAIYVHERLDVHHPVGQAKFLEEPAQANAGLLQQAVIDGVKDTLFG